MENNINNNNEPEENESIVIPLAMQNEMLRVLYEMRVPLYTYGGIRIGGGASIDEMEQAAADILARSLYDSRPVKHVIDIPDDESSEKHGIKKMVYNSETAKEMKINTTCGIWHEDFEEGEEIKLLPCNHAFKAEAITKWLTTEKAECPICRFKMDSKEVIVHSDEARNNYDDDDDYDNNNYDDNEGESDDDNNNYQAAQPAQPLQPPHIDEQRARENNIMNRQNNIIYNRAHAGGAADILHDLHYEISMPINRLIQMRRNLITNAREGARAGLGNIANAEHLTNAAHAARMASEAPQPLPSQNIQPAPIITNINNYNNNYYINQYRISAEEQEQADIEEAIRRSLQ